MLEPGQPLANTDTYNLTHADTHNFTDADPRNFTDPDTHDHVDADTYNLTDAGHGTNCYAPSRPADLGIDPVSDRCAYPIAECRSGRQLDRFVNRALDLHPGPTARPAR